MIVAFNLTILLDKDLKISSELYGVMAGSLILMVVGLWDDLKEIFWKIQLFFQVAVSVLIFIAGVRIYYVTNPWTGGVIKLDSSIGMIFSVFLVIFWIVLIINSINWLDGIDGLSGSITLLSALTIFLLSFRPEVNQPPVAIISLILIGVVLGFLIFNFNPARVLAGTSGAMFMGFLLASLAIFSGTKIATALMVLTIPIIDFIWVIGERMREGKSIFKPDKSHLHYKLLKLGWSQKKVIYYYCLITFLISLVALNTRIIGKGITMILSLIIMFIVLIIIDRKVKEY